MCSASSHVPFRYCRSLQGAQFAALCCRAARTRSRKDMAGLFMAATGSVYDLDGSGMVGCGMNGSPPKRVKRPVVACWPMSF